MSVLNATSGIFFSVATKYYLRVNGLFVGRTLTGGAVTLIYRRLPSMTRFLQMIVSVTLGNGIYLSSLLLYLLQLHCMFCAASMLSMTKTLACHLGLSRTPPPR